MNKKALIIMALGALILVMPMIMKSLTGIEMPAHTPFPKSNNQTPPVSAPALEQYKLSFSTYLGGSGYDVARDIFVDTQGNIYVTGGTLSANFPRTVGPAFNNGSCPVPPPDGQMDVFVAKFFPGGRLAWSRLLGGPCYDRAYAIEVDSLGYIYIAGRAGPNFPVTARAFQPTFQGTDNGNYGLQDAFVAKLTPDGSSVVWASYAGVAQLARDIAVDNNGDVYIPLGYTGAGGVPPAAWFKNAYQKSPRGGQENGALKIKSDGSQVLWATWLGGSSNDDSAASIRVDSAHNVYLGLQTQSTDIPTTPGAWDRSYNGGGTDFYVAKLSANGSNLLFGTYLGGSGEEYISTHNLALDSQGNVVASIWTNSANFPTTQNAFQSAYGGNGDMAVVKLSSTGALLASTYLGGSGNENPDGIYVDSNDDTFLTGASGSTNFPVTNGAYQTSDHGGDDAVLVKLSPDFSGLLYSTYIGGSSNDDGRSGFLDKNGSLYVTGQTDGGGWPVRFANQGAYAGGPLDVILAKFTIPLLNASHWAYLPLVSAH